LTIIFDVEIERKGAGGLEWPDEDRFETDSGLGGNRQYADMRDYTWEDYDETAAFEVSLVARLEALESDDDRCELLEALENGDDIDADFHTLMGLDPGVASAVIALSAAGCAPFTSCNGGAFGDSHYESHPLIGFFCRQALASLVFESAEAADVGLVGRAGGLVVYSRAIGAMMSFGAALHQRREEFDAVRRSAAARAPEDDVDPDQLDLFSQ
jgi:hypothetical protein